MTTSIDLFIRDTVRVDLFLRDLTKGQYAKADSFQADTLEPDQTPTPLTLDLFVRGTS